MPFKQYMNLVPDDCNEKTKDYIKRKLAELSKSFRKLKIQCGLCKLERSMFQENRQMLASKLRKKFPNTMVLLKGKELDDSPQCSSISFQQESYFYWAFGIEKPNLWGAIDVETAKSYIIYDCQVEGNKFENSSMDPVRTANKYKIDIAMSFPDMKYEMSKLGRNTFLVLSDLDEKSFGEMNHKGVVKVLESCGFWISSTVLTPVIMKCRLVKSRKEQNIMAIAAKINSDGIVYVIRNLKPGMAGYCTGAIFDLYIKSCARRAVNARPTSCLAGEKIFCLDHSQFSFFSKENLEPGDLCILDMGVSLHNYKTNLIATVPIDGFFTEPQAVIYNIVLNIRSTMLQELKHGISFSHLANIAHKAMVNEMITNFILEGMPDDIIKTGICEVFNPNGIGHLLGIDFYDCKLNSINHLVAKKGMVLALNSELYLNEGIIKKWMETRANAHLQSPYLPDYYGLAARVQDVVLITSDSVELLSNLPRTIEEMHAAMLNKFEMPFRKLRKTASKPVSRSAWRNIEMRPMMKKKRAEEPPCKNLLKLRYDHEVDDDKRFDLDLVLNKIKEKREWKPMKYLNEVMQEVYTYPYKIQNMLELVMIPLIPQRRRPSFMPYPKVSPIMQAQIQFPEQGYGCPYYDWNEGFKSCMRLIENCLDS